MSYKDRNFEVFRAYEENTIRTHSEIEHLLRGKFDRDRDRILYSKSFRRLSGKTQVFLTGRDDHIRNRLTHTLEVSQIARTISKQLGLNEILTEAIALGHDLGHTPFGHIGERTLNYIMSECDLMRDFKDCLDDKKGFKHNWQGLRVVMDLEESKKEYQGLNLTCYTMWGILNHSNLKNKECELKTENNICMLRHSAKQCNGNNDMELSFYQDYSSIIDKEDITIEALVVALADEISQRHHDVEDALEEKIIGFKELTDKIRESYWAYFREEDKEIFKEILKGIEDNKKNNDITISMLSSFMVNLLTWKAIDLISDQLKGIKEEYNISSSEVFEKLKKDNKFVHMLMEKIGFVGDLKAQDKKFQKYIYGRILHSHKVQCMDGKGNFIIREIFKAYLTNPQQLPDKTILKLFNNIQDDIERCKDRLGKDTSGSGLDSQTKKLIDEIKELYIEIEEPDSLMRIGTIRDKLEKIHYLDNKKYKQILMRTICDYIAGMTDKYAMELYSVLYETNGNN